MKEIELGVDVKDQRGEESYDFVVTERGRYRVWGSGRVDLSVAPRSDPDNPVLVGHGQAEGLMVPGKYILTAKPRSGEVFTLRTRKVD